MIIKLRVSFHSCLSYLVKSLVNISSFDNCIQHFFDISCSEGFINFNRKLGLIHIYVLVVNIFVRVCTALALSIFIPSIIRFCDCSTTISFITLYLILFNIYFQLYILLSLAVFRLVQDNNYCNSSGSNTANNLLRLGQTLHWGSCFTSQYNRICWTYLIIA